MVLKCLRKTNNIRRQLLSHLTHSSTSSASQEGYAKMFTNSRQLLKRRYGDKSSNDISQKFSKCSPVMLELRRCWYYVCCMFQAAGDSLRQNVLSYSHHLFQQYLLSLVESELTNASSQDRW